jgi:enoyl-CoA hydratase/carnithine racemase
VPAKTEYPPSRLLVFPVNRYAKPLKDYGQKHAVRVTVYLSHGDDWMSATASEQKILLHYSDEDGLAILELDDPPANTYSYAMMQQLDAAILKARMDDSVHVIVLRGRGEKFFCAGASISMLTTATPEFKYYFCLHANETLMRLEQTPKLVIAALNGHTVGGGLEVALACDIRLARTDGGKIGLPEVNLGVLPGTGGTQRLSRVIGRAKALEMMVLGRTFGFEEALQLGLIHHIFDKQTFWSDVIAYAKQFCPPHKASGAIGRIKRAVVTGSELPFAEALGLERELQQLLFTSEDAKEGLRAYFEKRPPEFKGR